MSSPTDPFRKTAATAATAANTKKVPRHFKSADPQEKTIKRLCQEIKAVKSKKLHMKRTLKKFQLEIQRNYSRKFARLEKELSTREREGQLRQKEGWLRLQKMEAEIKGKDEYISLIENQNSLMKEQLKGRIRKNQRYSNPRLRRGQGAEELASG